MNQRGQENTPNPTPLLDIFPIVLDMRKLNLYSRPSATIPHPPPLRVLRARTMPATSAGMSLRNEAIRLERFGALVVRGPWVWTGCQCVATSASISILGR
jgi:hypothetical protein